MTDRGITTAFNYVLLLGITSILVATLIIGVSGVVSTQQTDAVHAEFKVHGNKLASDIATVSYLAAHLGNSTEITITSDLPQRILSNQYTISVETSPSHHLVLRTQNPDVVVTIGFYFVDDPNVKTNFPAEPLDGGPITITFDENEVTLSDD